MVVDYIKTCEFNLPVDNMGDIPSNRNVPWQFSIETCTYTATTSQFFSTTTDEITNSTTTPFFIEFAQKKISTTSDIIVTPYFDIGSIMISFLLLFIAVLGSLAMLSGALSNIKTKKQYLQYKGVDVEIRKDL